MKNTFTKSSLKRALLIVLFSFVVIISKSSAQNAPQNIADSLQAILNRSLPVGVQNPGVVMSVYVPGQWTWSGASGHSISGMTSGQTAVMANAGDQFRVGSITKTFMATAIMMLDEQNLLSIEDTIGKYLRTTLVYDTINSSAPVRIRHLLNHTSGIDNSANNMSCQQSALANLSASHSLEEAIYCGASQGEIFPPEFAWAYSNTNYSILAMIIEKVTGQRSMDYIQQHIITPLNLAHTQIPSTDVIAASHMGCYWNIGSWIDMTDVNASLYWGWADIVSTTTDLNTFYSALQNGQLVNATSLTKMKTMYPGTYDYGLGLDFYTIGATSVPYYGHTGEVGNSSSMFYAATTSVTYPNGYYVSYNFNYQGVDMWTVVDEPVYNLLTTVVSGTNSITNNTHVSVYPNPTNDVVTFDIAGVNSNVATVKIFDITGRLELQSVIETQRGSNQNKISLSNLPAGVYYYEVSAGDVTNKGKIVKVN